MRISRRKSDKALHFRPTPAQRDIIENYADERWDGNDSAALREIVQAGLVALQLSEKKIMRHHRERAS